MEAEPSSPAARCHRHVTGSARSPASLSGSVTAILSTAAPPALRLPHRAQRAQLNPPKTPQNQQQTSSHPAPTAPVSISGYFSTCSWKAGKETKSGFPPASGEKPSPDVPSRCSGLCPLPQAELTPFWCCRTKLFFYSLLLAPVTRPTYLGVFGNTAQVPNLALASRAAHSRSNIHIPWLARKRLGSESTLRLPGVHKGFTAPSLYPHPSPTGGRRGFRAAPGADLGSRACQGLPLPGQEGDGRAGAARGTQPGAAQLPPPLLPPSTGRLLRTQLDDFGWETNRNWCFQRETHTQLGALLKDGGKKKTQHQY